MKRLTLSSALLLFKGWNDYLSSDASFFVFYPFFCLERCHKKVKKKKKQKKKGDSKRIKKVSTAEPLSVVAGLSGTLRGEGGGGAVVVSR